MSGHSKWSTIKRKKEKADAQRGKIFTKLIREITTAARQGGGDDSANPRLRTAVLAAKAANMPAANIEKAIKKGTGELPGIIYEEKTYEGYGPGGVAIIIDALTDNTNRTTAEVRHALTKHNGHLGESGSVAWMFDKKGLIAVDKTVVEEDVLMEIILDEGADDMSGEEDVFEIICAPEHFNRLKEALDRKNIETVSAEMALIAKTPVKIEGNHAQQILKLMDALEDLDDVQQVHSNFDIDDENLESGD